jgi:hypothetical protein
MKKHLIPVIYVPTEIRQHGKKWCQEWDAAFIAENVLYLCVAKHNMTREKVTSRRGFNVSGSFPISVRNVDTVIGLLCGTNFPKQVCDIGSILDTFASTPLDRVMAWNQARMISPLS